MSGRNPLPALWRRPGCCWRCCQPPCCGQLNCRGWSAEAPPPSLGSAQELAFLLLGHTHTHIHTHTHNALVTTGARLKVLHTYRTGCVRVRTHAGKAMLRSGGAPHQQCTNIHPHMPYGPNKKRTVSVLCLWQCKWMPYGLETTHDLNNDLCMKFSHIKIQHKQKESQRFWWGQKMEWKFQS